jgi:hypothetical protein
VRGPIECRQKGRPRARSRAGSFRGDRQEERGVGSARLCGLLRELVGKRRAPTHVGVIAGDADRAPDERCDDAGTNAPACARPEAGRDVPSMLRQGSWILATALGQPGSCGIDLSTPE